jgi:hypothetical protein
MLIWIFKKKKKNWLYFGSHLIEILVTSLKKLREKLEANIKVYLHSYVLFFFIFIFYFTFKERVIERREKFEITTHMSYFVKFLKKSTNSHCHAWIKIKENKKAKDNGVLTLTWSETFLFLFFC